ETTSASSVTSSKPVATAGPVAAGPAVVLLKRRAWRCLPLKSRAHRSSVSVAGSERLYASAIWPPALDHLPQCLGGQDHRILRCPHFSPDTDRSLHALLPGRPGGLDQRTGAVDLRRLLHHGRRLPGGQ